MSQDQYAQQDPTDQYPTPEQPEQEQDRPGYTDEMAPGPDHGEESYRGSGRLEGKKTVITGGDSGIGRAVAIAFAREGADVLLSYLPEEEEEANNTVRLVEDAGRKAIKVPGDISNEEQCRTIVDQAVAEFGHIDVLVNNAAYQMSRDGIADISTEEFDHTYKVNVYAMFWLCKHAIEHMPAGSSIINCSSVQAYKPSPSLLAYASTKGAIVNFTKGLAGELASKGIRVNTVAPGPIWTPLIPATMPGEAVKSFGEDTPLGRAAQPAEVAPAFVFLASQESSYITAERIGVHGGMPLP